MSRRCFWLWLALSGCPKEPAKQENLNPYHDVAPQKVKQQVEQTLRQEDERNDKRMEEMK